MIIRTIVPKLGEKHGYLGKPVKNGNADRIGSIVDVLETDDHYELVMEINGVYTGEDIMIKIKRGMGLEDE